MKRIAIEAKRLADGTPVFRFVCPHCFPARASLWLKELHLVERHRDLHARTVHAERAVA